MNNNDNEVQNEGEPCQRCSVRSHDLRTLWHACLYEMNELELPFTQVQYKGHILEQIGTKPHRFSKNGLAIFEEKTNKEEGRRNFYTLRVCKDCRADWLMMIKNWFFTKPYYVENKAEDAMIPYREFGTTVYLTPQEFEKKRIK